LFTLRRSRWRRTLVAAFAPYLFLSMFVDFVHVHPLVGADGAQVSAREAALSAHGTTTPDRSCPVCQWLRADTGLQTHTASAVTTELFVTDLVFRTADHPVQPIVLSRDLRGPPRQFFA
jgi:hypothetical protein